MLKSHEKFHSSNGKRLVLVADDEMINRQILGGILSQDYEVIFAEDGRETLDKVRENSDILSLVLLDLRMPEISGMEVLKTMKEDPETQTIPVIVITSDQESEIESLSEGASDFIPKPYPQAGVILARIRRSIELSEDRQIINSTERDPLTGLYNREYFYRYAEQYDNYHKDMEMDAIIIDINHFHMINERYGKEYGDGVLKTIGERVRDMVSDTGGIVCRREADTFMVYCPHGKDYSTILDNASIGLAGEDSVNNRVRLRMGVYTNVDKTLDIERRFDRAKMACDTVKNSFVKSIGIYDSALHDKEMYAEQLIEDFHKAIEERQFTVYYQPKFDIRPDIPVLASAEALVRWKHPELGMISPGVFIPLFEGNGMIRDLDNYVWKEAAAKVCDWKKRLGFHVPVSVNVSRIDMYDPGLIDNLSKLVEDNGLSTNDLLLEITESAYTQDSEQIIETVHKLRAIGFKVEMDDFGTGYSSLNMISTLPIDALKLDMQFIRTAFDKQKDTRMLEVIIDIADYLGVPVIAEGVETEEQLLALKAMGCDIVQGYYFSRPVPADEYEPFLDERKNIPEVDVFTRTETVKTRGIKKKDISVEKIAQSLSDEFESIFYVDTASDHFVEFSNKGDRNDLQMVRSGSGFFDECARTIMDRVYVVDRNRLLQMFSKYSLLNALEDGKALNTIFRMNGETEPEYYRAQAVMADSHTKKNVVIGIININDTITEEEKLAEERKTSITFSRIIEALAKDYFSIYYIDTETNRFIEFSSSEEYKSLNIEKGGDDFFNISRKNLLRVVHPDDQDMLDEAIRKENLMEALEREDTFTLTYRLIMEGEPVYVHMKATKLDDKNDTHIVIGVSNVNEQIKRELENDSALRKAKERAERDALTGVKSKYAFAEAEKNLNREILEGSAEGFAIAVCDLNRLKEVNDTHGHKAGDEYIKQACHIICTVFRHSPVYRIGGDEFAVILKGRDFEHRELLEEKIRENSIKHLEDGVVIAIGIAEYDPALDKAVASTFERADAAMYDNKKYLKGEQNV